MFHERSDRSKVFTSFSSLISALWKYHEKSRSNASRIFPKPSDNLHTADKLENIVRDVIQDETIP